MNKIPLYSTKSMKHMNPLGELDECIKIVRPAPVLTALVIFCVLLCIFAWIFMANADALSFEDTKAEDAVTSIIINSDGMIH